MTLDMSKYLDLFLTESAEHLEALSQSLVALEKGFNPAAVDDIFRHAHSVKGMSSAMGFEGIATVAHRVEDIVDVLRSSPNRLSTDVIDLLLRAGDSMMANVRSIADKLPEPSHQELIHALGACLTQWGAQVKPTRVLVGGETTVAAVSRPAAGVAADAAKTTPPAGATSASTSAVAVASGASNDADSNATGSGSATGDAASASSAPVGNGSAVPGGDTSSASSVSSASVSSEGATTDGSSGPAGGAVSPSGAAGTGDGSRAPADGSSRVGTDGGTGSAGSSHAGGGSAASAAATSAASRASESQATASGNDDGAPSVATESIAGADVSPGSEVTQAAPGPRVDVLAAVRAKLTAVMLNPDAGKEAAPSSASSSPPAKVTVVDTSTTTPPAGGLTLQDVVNRGATGVTLNEAKAIVQTAAASAAAGLPPRYAVKFRVAPSCPIPGVRAFLVHKRLTTLGNVFDLKPQLDDLKAGRIPEGVVTLELESSNNEGIIRQALRSIPDIELVSLESVSLRQSPLPVVSTPIGPAAPEAPRPIGQEPPKTVRVQTELLDYFLDTVGELLLATARIREVGRTMSPNMRSPLDESVDRLHGLVKDLHDKVMTVRMTPISAIMDRLPRVARDIARRRSREVELVISGAEIELDRAILDELSDPLMHLLRNCIDHGLEAPEERLAVGKPAKGRVQITVRRNRDRVVIELEDDGRGMDPSKLKNAAVSRGLITADAADRMSDREAFMLSCMPGVSTASDVTEISGRGVGMDAVKRVIENCGGTLDIDSYAGKGTRFTLRLPLTVAVVQLLLVGVGDEVFGLPIAKVAGAVELDERRLSHSRQAAMLPHEGSLLPIFDLGELLEVPTLRRVGPRPYVVMEGESGRLALAVDALMGQQELVLKTLSRPLDRVAGLAGVTILGSGRPIFILDVPRLIAA